ncbi:MAG: hypothetical protein ACLFV7_08150 [Phycisphaerae bacterium]
MRFRTMPAIAGLLLVASIVHADQKPALGSKDFYPSDGRPVGYRGDGNGWFPGATPVTEWQEGKPVRKEGTYKHRGRERKTEYWDVEPGPGRNIVWKTEMPSWANTQPLVVGDRVFTYGEPDLLICVDVRTGKPTPARMPEPDTASTAIARRDRTPAGGSFSARCLMGQTFFVSGCVYCIMFAIGNFSTPLPREPHGQDREETHRLAGGLPRGDPAAGS